MCHYFQAAALALRYLFPGHSGVGRYDAYVQVTAGLAVTALISRSLRGWRSQRLFPGPQQRMERLISRSLHVGWRLRYSQIRHRDWSDTYFQVAVGLAVTTLIPRSVTDWSDTYFQVAVGLAVTPRIPRSVSKQRLEPLISRL